MASELKEVSHFSRRYGNIFSAVFFPSRSKRSSTTVNSFPMNILHSTTNNKAVKVFISLFILTGFRSVKQNETKMNTRQ